MNYPPPPPGTPSAEFLNNVMPQVSPAMLNYGVETTSNLLKKQRDLYMPGVSNFWNSLKIYFMVNNNYVLSKLKVLLFPFQTKVWQRLSVDESYAQQDDLSTTHKWLAPRHDVNAPDLYLPVMAFVTYVLLVGYVKGTNNKFTPEVLIQAIWSCLLIQLIEVGIIKVGLSMLQTTVPFLDLFSYTGYKYVGLCIVTLSLLFGSTVYFIVSLYMGACISFFVLKSMAAAVPASHQVQSGGPPRHLVILGFAGMQFIVHSLLCYF